MSVLIWIKTVCKRYQKTARVATNLTLTNCFITPQVPTDETGALSLTAIVALLVHAGVKKMASMRTIDDCGLRSTHFVSKSELKHLYIVSLTPMA